MRKKRSIVSASVRKQQNEQYYARNRDRLLENARSMGGNRGRYALNPEYYRKKNREMSAAARMKHNERCKMRYRKGRDERRAAAAADASSFDVSKTLDFEI